MFHRKEIPTPAGSCALRRPTAVLVSCVVSALAVVSARPPVTFASVPSRDTLVVRVTAYSGSVWGSVRVAYIAHGVMKPLGYCARRKCEYRPPHAVVLVLTEKPKDPKQWPFRAWIVHNGGQEIHVRRPTLKLVVGPHLHDNAEDYRAHVRANYYNP